MRRGFSLMELAIVIVIAGLISGVVLQLDRSSGASECYATTKGQINTIREAMDRYVQKNDRLPMPASRVAGVEDTTYGREADPAALDAAAGVTFGALPFQALGLPASFGGDCWGNKFTYAVTTVLTNSTNYLSTAPADEGVITIEGTGGNTTLANAAYAIVSHGANGVGAVKINYRDTNPVPDKKWCAVGVPIENENCEPSNARFTATDFNDGKDSASKRYDDLIVFKGKRGIIAPPSTDCSTPWGATVINGASVTAYSATSAANCSTVNETRTCTNGVLSGSAQYASCTNTANCVWSGVYRTYAGISPDGMCNSWGACSGPNIAGTAGPVGGKCCVAYYTDDAEVDETTVPVKVGATTNYMHGRTCNVVAPPSDCTAPWGAVVANGSAITAYSANSAADCSSISETRTCTAGVLSGSLPIGTCTPSSPYTWWYVTGPNIPNCGTYVTCPLAGVGSACTAAQAGQECFAGDTTTCNGSKLRCTDSPPASDCTAPWGETVANGSAVAAYSAASAADCTIAAIRETRTCTNGTLSGSFANKSCTTTAPLQWFDTSYAYGANSSCGYYGVSTGVSGTPLAALPVVGTACSTEGETISNTDCANFDRNPQVIIKARKCQASAPPSNCTTPWGAPVASGSTVTAYSAASAPDCNEATVEEERTCINGSFSPSPFSGGFTHQSCVVSGPSACWTIGNPIPSGWSMVGTTPMATTFGYGGLGDCLATFGPDALANYPTMLTTECVVPNCILPIGNCNLPWGGTIANGASVAAYSAANAPDCNAVGVKETRTCNAGVLSGSFANQSCTASVSACRASHITFGLPSGSPQIVSSSPLVPLPAGGECALATPIMNDGDYLSLSSPDITITHLGKTATIRIVADVVCIVSPLQEDLETAENGTVIFISGDPGALAGLNLCGGMTVGGTWNTKTNRSNGTFFFHHHA